VRSLSERRQIVRGDEADAEDGPDGANVRNGPDDADALYAAYEADEAHGLVI
jgi:hypothetical protein